MLLAQVAVPESGGLSFLHVFVGGTMLLLVLGLIAAALYHTLRWLRHERRPANPLAMILMGVPALFGVAFLAAVMVWFVTREPGPPEVQWAYGPYPEGQLMAPDWPVQHYPQRQSSEGSARYGGDGHVSYSHVTSHSSTNLRFLVLSFPVALLALFALWRHFSGSERHEEYRWAGWKFAGTVLGLLFFGMFFMLGGRSHSFVSHVERPEALDESLASLPSPSQTSIEELHEKLTEPRIKLEEEAEKATAKDAEGVAKSHVTVQADDGGVKSEKKTTESSGTAARTAEPQAEAAVKKVAATNVSAEKPDWVANPPKRTGSLQKRVVSAGPHRTLAECYRQIEQPLQEAVRERLEQLVSAQPGMRRANVSTLPRYGITTAIILEKLCDPKDEYVESRFSSAVGEEMKTLYVLLEFGPEEDAYLLEQFQRYERQERIAVVAIITAFVLGTIAAVWGLLWLDTWTRGYYTKRLFLGVPAAIIGGVALIALIAEMS